MRKHIGTIKPRKSIVASCQKDAGTKTMTLTDSGIFSVSTTTGKPMKRKKKRINLQEFYAREAEDWERAKALGSETSLRFIQDRLNRSEWSWTDFSLAVSGLSVREKDRRLNDLEIISTAIVCYRKLKPLMEIYDQQIEELNERDKRLSNRIHGASND